MMLGSHFASLARGNVEVGERFTGFGGVDDLEMRDLDVFHLMGPKSKGVLKTEAGRVGSVLDKFVVAQVIQKRTSNSATLFGKWSPSE